MAIIERLFDNDKQQDIYPVTKTEAVYTTNGNTLDVILSSVNEALSILTQNVNNINSKLDDTQTSVYKVSILNTDWSGDSMANVSIVDSSANVSKCNIIICPLDDSSLRAYGDCNIQCVSQNDGYVSFKCDNVPSSDIELSVLVFKQL